MKVLLFSGARNLFSISGLGRAILHQKAALTHIGIEYTEDINDDYDIVHINTYTPSSKRLLDFVELAREMPDQRFIWFGKTPLWTVPHKIRKAVRTKIPNLIFAGYVPPEELKKAYVGSDLFAFMTYEETEGIVLLEALAAGQNVLVRDIPAFDWLEDRRNVYKAHSQEQFRQLTKSIIAGKTENLAEKGREAVSDKSIEKTGERLFEAYKTALDLSKKRQHNSR